MSILSGLFGPQYPEAGWVAAPGYLLRRWLILKEFQYDPRPNVLEIGCGAGALLSELSSEGFSCTGIESSPLARQLAVEMTEGRCQLLEGVEGLSGVSFDYLLAFEVLEHIDDHHQALRSWCRYLKPHGKVLLSMPARPELWGAADEWAGHKRRYTREGVEELLNAAGLDCLYIASYGVPVRNLAERVRHWQKQGAKVGTELSGIERGFESQTFPWLCNFATAPIWYISFQLQRLFFKTNLGTGFFVVALKRTGDAPIT